MSIARTKYNMLETPVLFERMYEIMCFNWNVNDSEQLLQNVK